MNLTNAVLVGLALVGLCALVLAYLSTTGGMDQCMSHGVSYDVCAYSLR